MGKNKDKKSKKNKKSAKQLDKFIVEWRQSFRDQLLGPGHGEEDHPRALQMMLGETDDEVEDFLLWLHRIDEDNHFISHQDPSLRNLCFSGAFFTFHEDMNLYSASVTQLISNNPGRQPVISTDRASVAIAIVDLYRHRMMEFVFNISEAIPFSHENMNSIGLEVDASYEPEENEAWLISENETSQGDSIRCILRCARLGAMIRPDVVN